MQVKQTKDIFKSAFTKRSKSRKTNDEFKKMRRHYWYLTHGEEKAKRIMREQNED